MNAKTALVKLLARIMLIAPPTAAKTKEQKQAEVRKSADQTLAQHYKARPGTSAIIKAAAGYAFSNFGMKILLAGGGKGQASSSTTKRTSTKMMI
jgi:hypothetical protein